MKRTPRDPNKPRRKFKPANARSPGRLLLAKQRRRTLSVDPDAGGILEQVRAALGNGKGWRNGRE